MVFDTSHRVKTLFLGKRDLFEVVLKHPALFHALASGIFTLPGLRYVKFVEQAEIHPEYPFGEEWGTG